MNVKRIWQSLEGRWREWRDSDNPAVLIRGPWPGWRRSYLMLALAFMILALLPWIWIEDPPTQTPSSEEILRQGRVGEAVLPGSSIFLDPGDPLFAWESVPRLLLRPMQPPRLQPPSPPRWGELARFRERVWESEEINRLARAELQLGRGGALDSEMQEAILQREIESEWLREEGELQGIRLPESPERFVSPSGKRRLLEAGFSSEDIKRRTEALLLASSLRQLALARGLSARNLEAEWVQRWGRGTSCSLSICLSDRGVSGE